MGNEDLSDWIKKELVADDKNVLGENKDRIKKLLRITSEGKVSIENSKLNARSQVGLYFVGAAYAKTGGLRSNDEVVNKELIEILGMPEGTVRPKVKELRDNHFVESTKEGNRIIYARISKLLDEIESGETKGVA